MYPLSNDDLMVLIDKAVKNFEGNTDNLTGAIGFLMVGQKFGWRIMFFMYSQASVRKYEKILNIKAREYMPELGPYARKAVAWQALQKVTNFWKAVKGEIAGVRSKEVQKRLASF